jgi:hypothetical protein
MLVFAINLQELIGGAMSLVNDVLRLWKERDGKPSMTRLLLFLWAGGTFVLWACLSLRTGELQDLPDAIAAIVATLAAGKAAQRFAERQ